MAGAGQRVGEFVLAEKIGQGQFGEVWRAVHHAWHDQIVAVKIPTTPEKVRNLQREGHAVHGLSHPNIVRAINFDPYADPPYLIMEYVPGASLRTLISRGRMKPEQALTILKQVLQALDHAHSHGVVHRDIKPENILLQETALKDGSGLDQAVKVTDFGLGQAAVVTTGSIRYSASIAGESAAQIVGTIEYMAPEQRQGKEADARADLYACGVVLFEMLTGERPVGPELPSQIDPSLPPLVDVLFRRSCARVDQRFQTARQFLAALAPPKTDVDWALEGTSPDAPRLSAKALLSSLGYPTAAVPPHEPPRSAARRTIP